VLVLVREEFSNKDLQFYNGDSISELIKDDLTIVIPVLNEEEGIGKVIKEVKNEGYRNILVVDGYSTDKTVSIASNNGVKIVYQHGIGKTGAIKTAIDHIVTPYFIVMDGDCTYDPKDIHNFFPHLVNHDEIIGSRTFGRKNIPFLNRFGNWIINFCFNLLFGTNLIDVCSGMYALRTDFAKTLNLNTRGFDVEVEIAAQTAIEGSITQVPINYYERIGQQKLRPWKHGLQILSTVWKLAISNNPVFLFSALGALTIIPALIILFWVLMESLQKLWHSGWALLGVMLLTIGLFSLILSTISMLIKRMEQRIMKKIKST
jgi:glycosyltransferase involved in cell wall biosynthesis